MKIGMLDVVIDGVIFQLQAKGGISRIYSEILPRMCEQEESLRVTLLMTENGAPQQPLPHHASITRRAIPQPDRFLRPWRVWHRQIPAVKRLINTLWIGDGAGKIWHSTYYTQPAKWRGPQVVTVLDMIYERYPNLFNAPHDEQFRQQKRRAISQASAVICISETTRRDVEDYYGVPREMTFVVPLAHSDLFRPFQENGNAQTVAAKPFFLYVGKRAGYKNFDLLLEAYRALTREADVDLVVVSDSDWTTAEQQRLTEPGLSARVRLLKDVGDEQLRQLYAGAAAFVYPSLYEGFGIPLLEAMACGSPVVASDIPSTREVAGDCVIYFDPHSREDLQAALEQVLAESSLPKLRAAGIARAATFSWDETARRTLEIYRAL